jgi:succinoglycan biosynthesis transport protein ExoP
MDEELQESHEPLDFTEIKGVIRRRRWQFLIPFFFGWLLVWGISWLIPSTYRSGTLILIEQPDVPEKYVVSNIDSDLVQRQLNSITEQILSRTRLLRIIDSLGLYAEERKHESADDLVEKMSKEIDIELSHGDDQKQLSAFYIYYANRDPKVAQATTAELANLFIKENLEQRQERSEKTTKFLEDQLEQARGKLEAQEAKMRVFKDQHLGELPTQTQSNLQILAGLQNQVQENEDSLNRAKQQNTYLESLINQYKALDRGTKPGTAGPAGLAEIERELDQLKAQLTDLTSHYTDKHPDVRKTKEQIARTEKIRDQFIADINKPVDNSTPATVAPASLDPKSAPQLELESQLKANRLEISNREAEIKDEQSKISQYQARLNMAPVMEQRFADITRDYDQSKADYESLLAKKNQSEMSTHLEKTQQGEHFRMLDPPNFPVRPYKPNRLMLCGVGLAVGLALGGGFAFGKEKFSGKIYSEREIKKLVPFLVIAEIPPIESLKEQSSRRRSAWLAGTAAVAVIGCILLGSAATYLFG